jgi:mono/diheme cytochrome c family protein
VRSVQVSLLVIAVCLMAGGGVPTSAAPQGPPSNVAVQLSPAGARALLDQYCVSCHNERAKIGGLALDHLDVSDVPAGAEIWEKVVIKLRAGMMPPAGGPRPAREVTNGLVNWLETTLDRAAAVNPEPGRPLVHRLNRVEYANAIRDLLALDVDTASLLPTDDSSYGFDNIADALGVSPALMERYLSASDKISALAIGDPAMAPIDTSYRPAADATHTQHVEGLPLGTRGGMLIRHTFPVDGNYIIKPKLWRTSLGEHVRGVQYPHDVEVAIDGERVHLATIGGAADFEASVNTAQGTTAAALDERLQVRLPVKAGPRTLTVTFLEKSAALPQSVLQPFERVIDDPVDTGGVPQLSSVVVTGPLNAKAPGDTPSRRRIFVCRPTSRADDEPPAFATAPARSRRSSPEIQASEDGCARRILSTLARRAYRRPVTNADVQLLLGFFRHGRDKGGFDAGIELGLRRILVDPEFIFRAERVTNTATTGSIHRVSDVALASRLSFFLWSSIPDDELLDVAIRNTLHEPAVLERQVTRMLADPRAGAMVKNFAGQWLYLRNLDAAVPDRLVFPNFDDNLRQAFRRETELLVDSVMREDRNVLDLLTADYTFVNERLARHYGIPHVYGSRFRRVPVTDDARKGLLGHGSILTVTSLATRTAPTLRGKWILDNILGTPPPPPPPVVPALKDPAEKEPVTMREQMEAHRANPTCAACHRMMDPLGFALENFDGVGAWRSREGNTPVDASAELVDGTPVNGPAALRQALRSRPAAFVATLTEKLLTYALGRGLTYHDMPAVRAVVEKAEEQDYRFSRIVLGIVTSVPFQMSRSEVTVTARR